VVTAYAPFGRPGSTVNYIRHDVPSLLEDQKLKEIALQHGKTVAQVILRYLVSIRNTSVSARSSAVTFFAIAWWIYQFLRTGWFGVRTPGEAKRFSLLHNRPDRPCGPNSPVNNGNLSLGWGVALTTSPPSSPEVKNEYICTCIPLSVPTWHDMGRPLPLPVTYSVNLPF